MTWQRWLMVSMCSGAAYWWTRGNAVFASMCMVAFFMLLAAEQDQGPAA